MCEPNWQGDVGYVLPYNVSAYLGLRTFLWIHFLVCFRLEWPQGRILGDYFKGICSHLQFIRIAAGVLTHFLRWSSSLAPSGFTLSELSRLQGQRGVFISMMKDPSFSRIRSSPRAEATGVNRFQSILTGHLFMLMTFHSWLPALWTSGPVPHTDPAAYGGFNQLPQLHKPIL